MNMEGIKRFVSVILTTAVVVQFALPSVADASMFSPFSSKPTGTTPINGTVTSTTSSGEQAPDVDPLTGLLINAESGLMQDPKTGAVYSYDQTTGTYTDTATGETLTLDEIRERIGYTEGGEVNTNSTPYIEFTPLPEVIHKSKSSEIQKIPFIVSNVTASQIELPKGYLVKAGQPFEKHITQDKNNPLKFTFDWDNSQSDPMRNYSIRIVVREKASGSGAVGGKILVYDETPINLVDDSIKVGGISYDEPIYTQDGGKDQITIKGKVDLSKLSNEQKTKFEKSGGVVILYHANKWYGSGQSYSNVQTIQATVKTDGTYTSTADLITPPTNIAKNTSRIAYAYDSRWKAKAWVAAGSFVLGTVLSGGNPAIGAAAAYAGVALYSHFTDSSWSSASASTTAGGTGPAVGTDVATGLGTLVQALQSFIEPKAGGDAEGELAARILNIINMLLALASGFLAFAFIWTGLLYIFSMGNEEQATKAKKNITSILTGLVILLFTLSIITIVRTLLATGKFG